MNSKKNQALIKAYKDGYRVKNGQVISPRSGCVRRLHLSDEGYPVFTHRLNGRKTSIMVQ